MSRYWVQGTGNWSDDEHHWATESNGSPGIGNLPTSSDDVFIDEFSGFGGGGTITLDVDGDCKDLDCDSGHTYSIDNSAGKALSVYGSIELESGLALSGINQWSLHLASDIGGNTITINGATIEWVFYIGGHGTWILQDDLVLVKLFYMENGTFDANDYNVTATEISFYADLATPCSPTVNMGSGTWTATADGWQIDDGQGGAIVIDAETSTLIVTDIFQGDDKTYNIVRLTEGELPTRFNGSNIISELIIDAGVNVKFYEGITQTIATFTANGTAIDPITLDSVNGADQFTLSKTSGIVNCDYLDISNSNATGGADWYAGCHSLDTENNDGWKFISYLDSPDDEWAYGEENTTRGETEVSWATWSDGDGGSPTIIGDADWGKLELAKGAEARSLVYDCGDSLERVYALEENRYGTGQQDAVLQIRGDTSSFLQDDVNPAWETFTCPVTKSWRYVQIREIYS
jgi:hypothetical protein